MYNDDMSVKYQITLPDPLAEQMRATATRLKIPLAQFIRETMEDKLRELQSKKRGEGPLEWMKGMAKGIREADLAARVDEVLYK